MSGPPLAVRRRRAGILVIAAASAVSAALVLSPADRPSAPPEAAPLTAAADGACPPAGFEEEALRLEGRQDLQVDERNGLVGYSYPGSVGEALGALEEELFAKGWSGMPGGEEGTESFVKQDGRYRWMFVACVGVGETTSVVVRYTETEGA